MTVAVWASESGVIELPDAVRVRGRGVRHGPPAVEADWSLFVLGRPPAVSGPPSSWVRWPDFALPVNWREERDALCEAHARAATQRVEIACAGGKGRTGTAPACLATLSGLSPGHAVAYVRAHYHPHAVEMPWQRLFIRWFRRSTAGVGDRCGS